MKQYRVWWIPQVPMEPFYVPVSGTEEAKFVLRVLAYYDLFQFAERVKGDYCNAGGLQVLEDGEWLDWEDENGYGIDEQEPPERDWPEEWMVWLSANKEGAGLVFNVK